MAIKSSEELVYELEKLANLLEVSAGVARRVAAQRSRNRDEIYDLADDIEEAATALHEIVESDRARERGERKS